MITNITVLQDVTHHGGWEVIEEPSTVEKCSYYDSVILFAYNGADYHYRPVKPIVKPNLSILAYLETIDPTEYTVGHLEVEEVHATYHYGENGSIRLARSGWDPSSIVPRSSKTDVLIDTVDGVDMSTRLYSLGGLFHLNSQSIHGTYLKDAVRFGMGDISLGYIDFCDVGKVNLIPFSQIDGFFTTDDTGFYARFDITSEDRTLGKSYLMVIGGRLLGLESVIKVVNTGVLKCPLRKDLLAEIFGQCVQQNQVDFGIMKNSAGAYSTKELLSDEGLAKILYDDSSFLIEIDTPSLYISMTGIEYDHGGIIELGDNPNDMVIDDRGRIVEYKPTYVGDGYIGRISPATSSRLKANRIYDISDGAMDVSLTPRDRLHKRKYYRVGLHKKDLTEV